MLHEIHEQPIAISATIAAHVDARAGRVVIPFDPTFDAAALTRVSIAACGTALHAGMIARAWFETFARLPVDAEPASEYRSRLMVGGGATLCLAISQSGETADTLAAFQAASRAGHTSMAIVNVERSSIARIAGTTLPTLAGPEIGVASTKAFTCQLAVLAALAVGLGRLRGVLSREDERRLVDELVATSALVDDALRSNATSIMIGQRLAKAKGALFVGRGQCHPLALEGALKLKELSYIPAEGHAAGELKHGPIALIDESLPAVAILAPDGLAAKTASNVHEIMARGGPVLVIGDEAEAREAGLSSELALPIRCGRNPFFALPFAIPLQVMAYAAGDALGHDIDRPRNLAKSVTVE